MNIAQIEGEMKNILQNFGGEKKNTENCSEKKENMISNAFFYCSVERGLFESAHINYNKSI